MTDNQLRVVNACEQLFWETGSCPTQEKLAEFTAVSVNKVKSYFQTPEFRQALVIRGIDLTPSESKHLLSTKQLLVANMLLNSYDRRSEREKLLEAGVSSQQLNIWKRDPTFQAYLSRRAEQMFQAADADAFKALVETVKGGDTQAIKLFMEMRGKYNPRLQVDVNVEQILVMVVEVISRHVKNPETLQLIAEDLQRIDRPTAPTTAIPVGSVPVPVSNQFGI